MFKSVKQEIRKNWSSGKHPISFSGVSNVQREYPHVPKHIIQDALAGIDTYSLFREEKKPKQYNPVFVRNKREILQSDLIDLQNLSEFNNDYKYLLVVIDTFSRFAWIEPLKSKKTAEVLASFKQIMSKLKPLRPNTSLMTDQGGEYINKSFQDYLKKEKVQTIVPNNKCPHVERFNRTFQNILYKYLEEAQTKTYINKLDGLLSLYNNRYHRIIKTAPAKAEKEENYTKVRNALDLYYSKVKNKKPSFSFKIGDLVRITAHKKMFQKGYYQSFLPKIYKIIEIISHLPITMYKIADKETNTPEAGTWYGNELQLVSNDYNDTLYKIEEVLKTKGKGKNQQSLVKWKYWPNSYNSWVKTADIENI